MKQKNPIRIFWEKTQQGTVRILRVFGMLPLVSLPEQIDGMPVTEIGAYCFARTRRLPEVYEQTELCDSEGASACEGERESGENVTEHKRLAELAGAYVTEVSLPKSVEKIGNLAFYNCTALKRLELGDKITTIGSDAFMNCRSFHLLTMRCEVTEKSCLRFVLSQVTSDLLVTFEKNGNKSAAVFYPEYQEILDEVAPAHTFHRNIEGEGFRARQCFKEDIVDLAQYDLIFPKACVEENARTLREMACARLCYPAGLTKEARGHYRDYLSAHEKEIIASLVGEKDIDQIKMLCESHFVGVQALEEGIKVASKMEWATGVAALLHLKQDRFGDKRQERYSFDEF